MEQRPINTRLRFVRSRTIERIEAYINGLPFMVEIKGGPSFDGKKWHLLFVLPDDMQDKKARLFLSKDLDKIQ